MASLRERQNMELLTEHLITFISYSRGWISTVPVLKVSYSVKLYHIQHNHTEILLSNDEAYLTLSTQHNQLVKEYYTLWIK